MRIQMLALAPVLTVALLSPARADYYDGLRAYDAGDRQAAAREWLRAARAGDPRSQFQLGRIYQDGSGVPRSLVHAHLWYGRAAAGGYDAAREARDAVAKRMSAQQIARSRELAVRNASPAVRQRSSVVPTVGTPLPSPKSPAYAAFAPSPRDAAQVPAAAARSYPPQSTSAPRLSGSFDGHWSGRGDGDTGTVCARWFEIDLTVANGRATGTAHGGSADCPLSGVVLADGTGYFGGWCGFAWTDIKVSFGVYRQHRRLFRIAGDDPVVLLRAARSRLDATAWPISHRLPGTSPQGRSRARRRKGPSPRTAW